MTRARAETFGAWVRVDDRTLLAVDRATARRFGVDGGGRWQHPAPSSIVDETTRPLEVHVAVTARCPVACSGCYLDAHPDGEHRAFEEIAATLDDIAARGVFTVAFGGGEPLSHPELPRIAAHARARGLLPVVTTSGVGLTAERARELSSFAQVNVSHDGLGAQYRDTRGFDGARVAERALATLVEAGVPVGVNVVLTRALLGGDGAGLLALVDRVIELGAREVQLLRYKPQGRAASLEYLARRLTPAQVAQLPALISTLVSRTSVRIDCALVPLLSFSSVGRTSSAMVGRASSAVVGRTSSAIVADLVALGVMGCEAGRALGAVDVHGRDAPCSFLPGMSPADVSAFAAPEPCASCPVRAVCRGGCRVVSRHLQGDPFVPDPECPRVQEARR
ncbi:MAG: radical SAM protein [Deltaproteobacteria bacterium]|nr:radical SAM protein [Deltaproteobacteria bacterium]